MCFSCEGQGLAALIIDPVNDCPPPFRRKAEGHCFWLFMGRESWCVMRDACVVVRGSGFLVGTWSQQLLLKFKADPFLPYLYYRKI